MHIGEVAAATILVIRRMKPLGYTLDEMKGVMSDLEVLEDPATDADGRAVARHRLDDVRRDADERRERLARQLGMADEFITLLDARRG